MGKRRQQIEQDQETDLSAPAKRQKTFKFKKLGQRISEVKQLSIEGFCQRPLAATAVNVPGFTVQLNASS